jgi:hypothetical protein
MLAQFDSIVLPLNPFRYGIFAACSSILQAPGKPPNRAG